VPFAERPVCLICGHSLCPGCLIWCDTLLPDEDGDLMDLCCDGECQPDRPWPVEAP
jgi:hypothetical protein